MSQRITGCFVVRHTAMNHLFAVPLSLFLTASLVAEDELPKDPRESLDIEPPLLIEEIPSRGSVQSTPGLSPERIFDITEVTAIDLATLRGRPSFVGQLIASAFGDSPDADAETNMKLKIGVKVRPNTVIDHTKVKIQVFFYDTVDNKEVVLTDAHVSYEWLTPHHDWKDTNPEVLAVTLRPKKKVNPLATGKNKRTKEPSNKDTHRRYLGYIIRIYYHDQLQAARADPSKLLNLFPPPITLPSR